MSVRSAFSRESDHPLQLMTGDRDVTLRRVLSGEAHLGVTALEAVPPGIDTAPLSDVEQVLVLPLDHPLARRRRLRLSDLQGMAVVVPLPDRPHRALLNRLLLDAGVTWRVAVEAGGWELMVHFVALGIGLSVVNACCRLPEGLVAKRLEALPRVRYQVLQRSG